MVPLLTLRITGILGSNEVFKMSKMILIDQILPPNDTSVEMGNKSLSSLLLIVCIYIYTAVDCWVEIMFFLERKNKTLSLPLFILGLRYSALTIIRKHQKN